MRKLIGYLLAGLGLLGLAANSKVGKENLDFLVGVDSRMILIGSLVLLVVGVVIMIISGKGSKKIKQVEKEVPIYQGEGKKRKIVGYKTE